MTGEALIATLALGGMCILMWWLARLAKKRMGIGAGTVSSEGLRVVGKRPLDQKSSLFVVEIAGGRHILLGSGVDGTVTKLDDISPAEFESMTADPKPIARPKLRVASKDSAANLPSPIDTGDANDASDADAEADAPRFATVGESFSLLLGKARDKRASRRPVETDEDLLERPASGE
jgi:flagellar biogenesis protein FliO